MGGTTTRLVTLGAWLAILGGCTNGVEWEPDAASSVSSPGFAWEAKSFAPKNAPPPERAATWDWPSESEFETRFSRWPSEAWALGVLIGDWVFIDSDSGQRNTAGPEIHVAQLREHQPPLFLTPWTWRTCRGSHSAWSSHGPILAEEPFSPGELELQPRPTIELRFHVQSVAPPRRMLAEDWRDWVYARTLLDYGIALADANRETAAGEERDASALAEDEQSWDRLAQSRLDREAELANACYEAGLVACYLVGRLAVLHQWTINQPVVDPDRGPPLPASLAPGVLDRGPVDLARFSFGLLLDWDLYDPQREIVCGHPEPTPQLARLIADSTALEPVADELHARALDPRRDPWTRAQLVSLLTALHDLQLARDETQAPGHADTFCALAVLASPDWTIEEAHARCVGPRLNPDFSWARQARGDALVAMKLLDQEPR